MAKILEIDLETSPNLGWAYGKWDTKLIKIEKYSTILSFSWKWRGEDVVHHLSLATVPRKKGTSSNKALAKALWDLFDEADAIMAHNAYKFDIPVATAAFAYHRLGPPSPYKIIDTLRIARKEFKFPGGNGLNDLAEYFGVKGKEEVGFGSLWYRCIQGDPDAWRLLQVYNDQDIVVMDAIYEIMRPFSKNHVNLADIDQVDGVCPRCLSSNIHSYGSAPRRNGRVKTYRCHDCGGRCAESKLRKEGRLVSI